MKITWSTQFKKDFKLAQKQGRDLWIFMDVLCKLVNNESLEDVYRVYHHIGWLSQYYSVYMQRDWELVIRLDRENNELYLARMGDPGKVS